MIFVMGALILRSESWRIATKKEGLPGSGRIGRKPTAERILANLPGQINFYHKRETRSRSSGRV
jgi:hypothetical protein